MILCRMAFQLPCKVFALHLYNCTAKAYLCNQGDTVSPFLSRLACRTLCLTTKVSLLFKHSFLPISMWQLIICPREGCFWSGIFFLTLPKLHFNFGVYQRWISWHPHVPSSVSSITPLKLLPLWALGLNGFSHPWMFQVSYVFPPPALVPLVLPKFLAEHVGGQLRLLTLVAPCWMEAPWLPTVLNMLEDAPQHCPVIKGLIMDVLVGQALWALPYLHLTLWILRDTCCADKSLFPQSVRKWQGQLKCLRCRPTSNVERKGQVGVLE